MSVAERLVSFQKMKIAEANFPTLPKEQIREIVDRDRQGDSRRRARDRARPRAGQHRQEPDHPEERRGREGRSAHDLLQQDAGGAREPRRRADLEPDQGERPEVRGQHQLGSVPARADQDLLPAQQRDLAEGDRREGAVGAGRQAARRASRSCRPTTTGRTSRRTCPGKPIAPAGAPKVFVSTAAGGADSADRRAELSARCRAPALLWVSNTESDVFRMGKTGAVYYLVAGRWFSAPDFTGPWTFATPTLPADFKKIPLEHERSRVLASVPGTDAGRRSRAARADSADRARQQEGVKAPEVAYQGDAAVPADREDDRAARREHRQGHLQGRRPLLHVLPGRVVHRRRPRPGPGRSPSGAEADLRDSRQLARRTTSPTSRSRKTNDDDWVVFARRLATPGMMVAWGCAVWGTGYYYPPYCGLRRLLSVSTTRTIPTYGYSAWYNPWTGAYGAQRRRLRSVRRRRRRRALQPAHRHLLARRGGLRPVRRARRRRRPTTRAPAPTARRGRARTSTAAGARPPCSAATTGPRPIATRTVDRNDDAHGAGPTRAAASARKGAEGGTCRRRRRRQRLRRQGRQRLPPARRHVAEVRQRRLVEHRPAAERRAAHTYRTDRPATAADDHRSQHGRSVESRRRGAQPRLAADPRLRYLSQRSQQPAEHGRQLPRRRRRPVAWRRRSATVACFGSRRRALRVTCSSSARTFSYSGRSNLDRSSICWCGAD